MEAYGETGLSYFCCQMLLAGKHNQRFQYLLLLLTSFCLNSNWQVSFRHVCTLESAVNKPISSFLSFSSLYQLTAIAWERYMAIQKTMRYKVIVTKSLLQKLAIGTWLIAVITQVPVFVMAVVPVDPKLVQVRHVNASFLTIACLIAIAYFYIMVYLGVRKGKINEINQGTALMQAKLESKVEDDWHANCYIDFLVFALDWTW